MKFLLVLLVLVVAYQLWRAPRRRAAQQDAARAAPAPALPPKEMVRCQVCALHLPRPDALAGASGRLYCSHEHRLAGGD